MDDCAFTRMTMQTADAVSDNVTKIQSLFPDCVTETRDSNGNLRLSIDFDKLRQNLSDDIVEGLTERYQFTWPDKRKAIQMANSSIRATLRPCRQESVDFDTTHNLYIEGDNLGVLKCLRETYLGKVKMIYIDPPYNTGNDFVYKDDFSQSDETYRDNSGQFDEQGQRLVTNLESNGRFHTDWLNMIYPRLKVARDLLSDDGIIFISIDDHEQDNLRKVCDEIFGGRNFVAQLIWERAFAPKNDAKYVSNSHDYVVVYAKELEQFKIGRLPRTEEADARYGNPDNDPRGVWQSDNLTVKSYTASCDYPITTPSGRVVEPPAGRCWSLSAKAFAERLADNRIWFGSDGNGVPRIKRFLSELKHDGMAPTSILFYKEVGHSQEGSQEVNKILGAGVFDGPKPVRLLYRLLTLANLRDDSIVLDFFSGSGSMAHALMKFNAEKDTNAKYILVQVCEETDDKAKKDGYNTIPQIAKERIRRAGQELREKAEEQGHCLDTGFRVLKLDSTNMEDVYYTPQDTDLSDIERLIDNVKPDRTSEDLLVQSMLERGSELSAFINRTIINGKEVFIVNNNQLIATFDNNISEETITEIAKMKPEHFVMRDSSAASDNVLDNFSQIFRHYSRETKCKII